MPPAIELDASLQLATPMLKAFLARWDKAARTGPPLRRDFDPLAMRDWLGHLYLADVIGAGQRFRYRLVGTQIVRMLGRDVTGRHFDEIYGVQDYEEFVASFRWIVANRRPMRSHGRVRFAGKEFYDFEAIEVPLFDVEPSQAVRQVLGCVAIGDGPHRGAI